MGTLPERIVTACSALLVSGACILVMSGCGSLGVQDKQDIALTIGGVEYRSRGECSVSRSEGWFRFVSTGRSSRGGVLFDFNGSLPLSLPLTDGHELVGVVLYPISSNDLEDGQLILGDYEFSFVSDNAWISVDSFTNGMISGTIMGDFHKYDINSDGELGSFKGMGSFTVPVSVD